MKRYINRQITGTIHKGLVKILGEKGANLAWGGFVIFGIMVGVILKLAR